MIADDSATILTLVTITVQRAGYEPATATSGSEALDLIREHRPELVILDARMPGMSGYDVCREVRADTDAPQPHVIMLTAEGQQADRTRAESVGADEFMTKPFSPLALRARVREILGEP